MWRMHDGDRVLTEAEWEVFATGLDLLRHAVEEDILNNADAADTGVAAFDRLTAEQKLALLAEVARAVRDLTISMPHHTAANEGAIMAVLGSFRDMLQCEVEINKKGRTDLRECLLAAFVGAEDYPEKLPKATSKKCSDWDGLCECIIGRLFWDYDFAMGDQFLDLPPDEARTKLREFGIDPDTTSTRGRAGREGADCGATDAGTAARFAGAGRRRTLPVSERPLPRVVRRSDLAR